MAIFAPLVDNRASVAQNCRASITSDRWTGGPVASVPDCRRLVWALRPVFTRPGRCRVRVPRAAVAGADRGTRSPQTVPERPGRAEDDVSTPSSPLVNLDPQQVIVPVQKGIRASQPANTSTIYGSQDQAGDGDSSGSPFLWRPAGGSCGSSRVDINASRASRAAVSRPTLSEPSWALL